MSGTGQGTDQDIADTPTWTPLTGVTAKCAAALDTMRVMKLVDEASYTRGIDLLEGIVAMLTKMT